MMMTYDDGLLGTLVLQEVILGHSLHKAARIRRGLLHVVESR